MLSHDYKYLIGKARVRTLFTALGWSLFVLAVAVALIVLSGNAHAEGVGEAAADPAFTPLGFICSFLAWLGLIWLEKIVAARSFLKQCREDASFDAGK